ncbi:MAG: ABC transporter substrate-binding protein [Chloroflexaceae bacterium]|nr:ABC transporter substrate-binding protein [Chloroflexaceae bacterium]
MDLLIDAVGRTLNITQPPRRLISLVPSLTEWLVAIGAGERLVGVTDFCTEPAQVVGQLERIGGTKNPDRQHIIELQPDLVLASREENRLRDVNMLEDAGIAVYVTDICSLADVNRQLSDLTQLLGGKGHAAPFLQRLHAALAGAEAMLLQRRRYRVLTCIWRDPWMAIGRDTYAHDLLRLCGGDNIALAFDGRYPRQPLEALMHTDPEVILLPDEPFCFTAADRAAFEPFADVSAVRNGQIHLCDGKLLLWYGERSIAALQQGSRWFTGDT